MTLLSLFRGDHGLLASERLVFGAEEIEALHDAIAMSERLEQRLHAEDDRLVQAFEEASERGYAAGLVAGTVAAEARVTEQLESLLDEQRRAIGNQREQCSFIALEIVRRLAGGVADGDWLVGQALRAAEELVEQAPLTLHVHPERVDAVRLALEGHGTRIDSVLADDALGLDGCVLESRIGRVDASLETQLARLIDVPLIDDTMNDDREATSDGSAADTAFGHSGSDR